MDTNKFNQFKIMLQSLEEFLVENNCNFVLFVDYHKKMNREINNELILEHNDGEDGTKTWTFSSQPDFFSSALVLSNVLINNDLTNRAVEYAINNAKTELLGMELFYNDCQKKKILHDLNKNPNSNNSGENIKIFSENG